MDYQSGLTQSEPTASPKTGAFYFCFLPSLRPSATTSFSWLTNMCSIHFIGLCDRDYFLVLIGNIYSVNLFN
jgi:hypothetical protein